METSVIKFSADTDTCVKALSICNKLGIDIPTYLRMCMSRLCYENGIPFSMKIDNVSDKEEIARIMRECQEESARNGNSEMTLDEINAEIDAARREMA